MTNPTAPRTGSLKPCSCRLFEAGNRVDVAGGDVDFVDVKTTECKASTTRLFAQGHDAKLVSFLVAAELDGLEIALIDQGTSWGRAQDAAATISEALAIKAANMIATAQAKADKKAARKTAPKTAERKLAEAAKVVETAPIWRSAKIKVGRWTYDAQIETATGDATYAAKLGGTKMVERGQYSEV